VATVSATGTLVLDEGTNNPDARNIASDETGLTMLQLEITAGATEAVDISSVTFSTTGTGDESADLTSARIFQDVNSNGDYDLGIDSQIGSTLSSFTDDGDLVFSGLSEQISAGGTENWLVIYNLNGSASNDSTFRVFQQRRC